MSPRPSIFVSAVSRELRSARQLVVNTLTFLGYEPVWQDVFGTESGDLRSVLREKIDNCKGVVQLVGQCYGAEPPTPDETFGRLSYTQYEALYARARGKKVWYLFIDESFPIDPHEPESEELRQLQSAYRRRVQSDAHLFHSLGSPDALEAGVLKLRDDLTRLRRGAKQWAAGVAVLLVIIAAAVLWLVRGQKQTTQKMDETKQAMTAVASEMAKLRQGVLEYPQVETRVRATDTDKDPAKTQERIYAQLSKQLGVNVDLLKQTMPRLVEDWKHSSEATTFQKATAAYIAKDFPEAERLALQAKDEAQKSSRAKPSNAIQSLQLAGLSAERNLQYDRALEHFREAEKLTNRSENPAEWALVQEAIGRTLQKQLHYAEAEAVWRKVVETRTEKLGADDPQTLVARASLAWAKSQQGRNAEAETEFRELIKLDEKVFGPEDANSLWCRHGLITTLTNQGKYSQGESEFRELIKLDEKILGPEHPATLMARNNLALAMMSRGEQAEALIEYRDIARIQEKILGAEHPDTLLFRQNILAARVALQDYPDEAEARDLIGLESKVLGPENPQTLRGRSILARILEGRKRRPEAEVIYREVLDSFEKTLGPDDPETIKACGNLGAHLFRRFHLPQAKPYAERALKSAQKVFGPNHPLTKSYQDVVDAINSMSGAGIRPVD